MPILLKQPSSHDQTISRSFVWKAKEGTMTAYRRLIVSVAVMGFLVGTATGTAQLMDKKGTTLEAAKKIEGVNLGGDAAILQLRSIS
jgi:hypothetical protein